MLTPPSKSMKSVFSLRTHKHIRQAIQKQDFFDQLLTTIQTSFSQEQYHFLIHYILEEKIRQKDDKKQSKQRLSVRSRMNVNFSQDLICEMDQIQGDVFQTNKKIQRNRSSKTQEKGQQKEKKKKYKVSIKNSAQIYQRCCSESQKVDEPLFHRHSPSKFHEIIVSPKPTQRRQQSPKILPQKAQPKSVSKVYLLDKYNNQFINKIFDDKPIQSSFYQPLSTNVSDQFKDSFIDKNRYTELTSKLQEKENKYRHINSIRIERSPRKPRLRIHNRKF